MKHNEAASSNRYESKAFCLPVPIPLCCFKFLCYIIGTMVNYLAGQRSALFYVEWTDSQRQ